MIVMGMAEELCPPSTLSNLMLRCRWWHHNENENDGKVLLTGAGMLVGIATRNTTTTLFGIAFCTIWNARNEMIDRKARQ